MSAEELQKLQAESAALDDDIRFTEREIKNQTDRKARQENLEAECKRLEDEVAGLAQDVSTMNAEVTDFPTDTQVLKLERRVQHLKDQTKETERQKHQHKTGIEAYASRHAESLAIREHLMDDLIDMLEVMLAAVDNEISGEQPLLPTSEVLSVISTVVNIADEREAEVQRLCQEMGEAISKDQELTSSILAEQSRLDNEGPLIEAKGEEILRKISEAWNNEKAALQKAYDKLFVVNKEHRFHLARGTHVKRAPGATPDDTQVKEAALSARHDHLASALVEVQGRLCIVADDNKHTRRLIEKVKGEGRQAASDFETQRAEVQARLDAAKEAHNKIVEEASRFRSLKSELQHVLQNVREGSPTARA